MINCIYHPVYPMRVVDDEEYAKMLASGEWFKNPNEAKEVRKDYETQIRLEDERSSTQCKQRVREKTRSDGSIDGNEKVSDAG